MFFQFNFETQCNLDEQEMVIEPEVKQSSLPTTANNSPGSVKSFESFGAQLQNSCDVSFEEGTQVNHANNIWDASVQLISNSMEEANKELGFNNQSLYKYSSCAFQGEWSNIDQAIKGNRLLRYRQKVNFIQELQKQSQLCGLLAELMVLFNPRIFAEVVYVIHAIWNKKYLDYRQQKKKIAGSLGGSLIPKFNCFFGFEGQEQEMDRVSTEEKNSAEIVAKSEEGIQALAKELFSSRKLKYLNFQEIRGETLGGKEIQEQFELFVKSVARGVFLSAQGIFEQESVSVCSFSQSEEDVLSWSGKRFVRAYSQISQDGEEFSISSGRKRQKMF